MRVEPTHIALARAVAALTPADLADPDRSRWARQAVTAAEQARDYARAHPLCLGRLWEPECLRCDDPGKRGEWRLSTVTGLPVRGVTLEHVGGDIHRCPSCGVSEPRTSQRLAVERVLQPAVRYGIIQGGNRTGKSEAAAMVDVAFALGGAHPAVREWARVNRLNISRIQPEPGRVWSVGLTSSDSIRYVRSKVKRWIPSAWGWRNETGPGESYCGPAGALPGAVGSVTFKTVDQRRRGFQGDACHLVRFDEEPDLFEVFEEADQRLGDVGGLMLFSMTPLMGWTRLLRFLLRPESPDAYAPGEVAVAHLNALDNPHVKRWERLAKLAKLPAAKRAARERGEVVPLEGLVHPDFVNAPGTQGSHVVPAFDPPPAWARFTCVDFGFRNPFAWLWFALDPKDDVLHVYREHYRAQMRVSEHAMAIHAAERCPSCYRPEDIATAADFERRGQVAIGGRWQTCQTCRGSGRSEPEPAERWADPEDASARATLDAEYDLPTTAADKSRVDSFDALFDRLGIDREGRPHLVIHTSCPHTIREMEGIRWKVEDITGKARERDTYETAGDDHAHDCVRYTCHMLRRSGY